MAKATAAALGRLDEVADGLADAGVGFARSQMFGCPGLRRPDKGKFFATIWGDDLVVKVSGEAFERAMALPGAHAFEPMAGRPMRGWVVLPAAEVDTWVPLAQAAEAGLG